MTHGTHNAVDDPRNADVQVYINGSMAFSETKSISGEDEYTPFAMIDWGSGTVSPL